MTPAKVTRNASIVRRFRQGASTAAIAREFGISRERVRQILKRDAGLTASGRNDERHERLAQEYRESDLTVTALAGRVGISPSSLSRILKSTGTPIDRARGYRTKRPPPRVEERVADLYRDGMGLERIRRLTGMAKTTIRKVLARQGVEIRPPGSRATKRPWSNREVTEMLEMRRRGHTQEQIATALGRSQPNVSARLRDEEAA